MGCLDLPTVDRIKTPGFLYSLDEALESKCSPGGFTTSGVNWRMWLFYGIQIFFLFLCVVIGANIQIGRGSLGPTYDAVDILRLIGGLPGIVAALVGAVGLYIRMKYLLIANVALNTISILFLFLSWAIDASDASELNAKNGQTVVANGDPVNLTGPRNKAAATAVFGALGWVFTIIAFYLTYAHYQEMGGPAPTPKKQKQPKQAAVAQVEMGVQNDNTIAQNISGPTLLTQPSPIQVQSTRNIQQLKPTQAKSQGKMHNCPSCGTEWPFDVKFCGECGGKIDTPEPAPAPTVKSNKEVWEEHFTEDGYMYYYNPKTGESKWAEA